MMKVKKNRGERTLLRFFSIALRQSCRLYTALKYIKAMPCGKRTQTFRYKRNACWRRSYERVGVVRALFQCAAYTKDYLLSLSFISYTK